MKKLYYLFLLPLVFGVGNIFFFAYRYIWFGTVVEEGQGGLLILITILSIPICIPAALEMMDDE